MNRSELARARLRNHRLVGAGFERPEQVVRWLGAVQSQDYSGAKWGVAQRTDGITDADLDRELTDGTIIRTHVLRPTWHFVLAEDVRWMLALTAPRVQLMNASAYRLLGLDAKTLARAETILVKALRSGGRTTRGELAVALKKAGVAASGPRLGYIFMHAELEAVMCSGGLRGTQHTYALLDERVPVGRARSRDAALAELTRRYFTSHGPAQAQDFSWWSGLTTAEVKSALVAIRDELESVTVDGKIYWSAAKTGAVSRVGGAALLLPNFDELLVAYKDRGATFDRAGLARTSNLAEDLRGHAIVADGMVVGRWQRSIGKRGVTVRASLGIELDASRTRALGKAVERYARFTGMPVTLRT